MKAKYTLFLMAFIGLTSTVSAQELYDEFDSDGVVSYPFHDGTAFNEMFTNPDSSATNPSDTCARYVRNSAVQYDVLLVEPTNSAIMDNVADYVSGAKKMTMKIWSTAIGMPVQITLENKAAAGGAYPAGRHSEYFDTTTVSGAWEILTFDLVNLPAGGVSNTDVDRMVILFDPGQNSTHIVLFDDLMGPELFNPCGAVTPDASIGEDFECHRNVSFDFTNGTLAVLENPVTTGINTSTTCGKFSKYLPPTNDGAFGGAISNTFNTSTFNTAHIQLYDPAAPQEFKVVLQDGSGTDLHTSTFNTSSTTEWEKFTMVFPEISSAVSIEKFVFLLNSPTATIDSIYLDNFTYEFDPVASIKTIRDLPLTMYPSPFQDKLTIETGSGVALVTLRDLTGKTVAVESANNSSKITLETSDLPNGIYIVTVEDISGSVVSRKVIK